MLNALVLTTLLATASAPATAPQDGPTNEEVTAAWSKLDLDTKKELIEWFRSEVVWLDTFQNRLVNYVLETQPRDAGLWPLVEPAPYYDPSLHAPAQPIQRKSLAPTSSAVVKKREEFFFRVPERKLDSAWIYDYGTRELRRTQRLDDPERLFKNALNGFRPDLDLAEALVERQLDDGAQQTYAVAFAHAYTDRLGGVYTGLTLYDAWASGARMEMPDVDCLGVLHDLKDDWKSYTAPVPGPKQKPLYDEVGELFQSIHRHRGLRYAMALSYLSGYPVLRDGYGPNLDRLHALWDTHESTPEKLLKDLPKVKDWESFLSKWVKKVDRSKKLLEAGTARRDTLHNDGLWVRHTMISVMTRAGVLEVKAPKDGAIGSDD